MSAELRRYTHSLQTLGWVKFPAQLPSQCVVTLSVVPHSNPPRYEAKFLAEAVSEQKGKITLIFQNLAPHTVCFCTDGKHGYQLPVESGQRRAVRFPREWLSHFQFRADPESFQYSGFVMKKA